MSFPFVKRQSFLSLCKFSLTWGLFNCIHCGSHLVKESLLCQFCENELFRLSCPEGIHPHQVNQIPCWSLFVWEQDKNRILNKLIMNLKGTKRKKAWRYFAYLIYHEIKDKLPSGEKMIVVPCPNSQESQDHAYLLAKNLADFMNLPLVPRLRVNLKQQTKELNKKQRWALLRDKFALNSHFVEKITDTQNTKILFVDDVITTGATLLAAHEFHKEFKGFMGISLAFRR